MADFEYHAPQSLDEAFRLLNTHGENAHVIAGGTALVPLMRLGLVFPEHVVSLREIKGVREIGILPDGGLEIGALVTHREIERSALVQRFFPPLVEAFGRVATVRIRNQATIGGNLVHADPASDPPPMLMALDAGIEIASRAETRLVPVAEFFHGLFETAVRTGEIVTAIRIPPVARGTRGVYLKFLPGSKDDFATVSVAAVLRFDGERCAAARIGLGSVGATPLRARNAEAKLEGAPVRSETIEAAARAAANEVEPFDDARGSVDYKRAMTRVWVRRALESLVAR